MTGSVMNRRKETEKEEGNMGYQLSNGEKKLIISLDALLVLARRSNEEMIREIKNLDLEPSMKLQLIRRLEDVQTKSALENIERIVLDKGKKASFQDKSVPVIQQVAEEKEAVHEERKEKRHAR